MLQEIKKNLIVSLALNALSNQSKNYERAQILMNSQGGYGGYELLYQVNKEDKVMESGFEGYREIGNILKEYYDLCQNNLDTRWNSGKITIYPDGRYEESFIWNNDIYLWRLKSDAEGFVSDIYHQAYKRIKDKCLTLSIPFNFQTEVIASFTAGSANPVLFITPNNPEMTFSLYLEQIYIYIDKDYSEAFEEYGKIRKKVIGDWLTDLENWYFAMNEGELKGYYPRWNVARFLIDPKADYIGFDEVKFEWIPETEE